jgi:hypothetical protein
VEWLEWIIKIGASATAIGLLWKGVSRLVHFLDEIKENTSLNEIKEDIKELKDHSKENYLGIKRLTVMSHDMPIGERIVAGHDYIKAGGNGEVKHYIEDELHINDIQD